MPGCGEIPKFHPFVEGHLTVGFVFKFDLFSQGFSLGVVATVMGDRSTGCFFPLENDGFYWGFTVNNLNVHKIGEAEFLTVYIQNQ